MGVSPTFNTNMLSKVLFTCLLIGLVAAQTHRRLDWFLVYESETCQGFGRCTFKAQSARIESLIEATGDVKFHFENKIGPVSYWESNTKQGDHQSYSENGNFSFGVQSNRMNHTILFQGGGSYSDIGGNTCYSGIMDITEGTGAFKGI